MNLMILDKSNKYADNPRQITEKQFKLLDEHLNEFGDLGGVVYCVKNKAFVGGNMRSEIMNGAEIEIIEKFNKPTKNKTTAHGFIKFNGEKFSYREVSFTKSEFKKACVVANNDGGSFDWDVLSNGVWQDEDLIGWGLDVPGFDEADSETKLEEKEITSVSFAHFLVSVDINQVDKILPLIQQIKDLNICEVESNVN
jgi:hypothetical protein